MSDIWIVDDEPAICWALRTNLEEDRHRVKVFSTGESFLKDIEKGTPDLVLLDVRLPGVSGLELLKRLRGDHPRLPVIVMTAFGDISTAVQAVQGSAFEYLTKPFDLEEALQTIRKALAQSHLKPLSPKGSSDLSSDVSLGKSAAMQSVYKQIAVAATTDSSLLIEGEEGTGKNLVAVMIHRFSSRNTQPLLMTSSTPGKDFEFETELFGSGGLGLDTLQPLRTGLLELAGQGTLVIDDVGSISLANQQKILRAIESQSFCRVGDSEPKQLRCRVLFTSTQSIGKMLIDGELDRRLASQLEVFRICLPPLRERREDIVPMIHAFLQSKSVPQGMRITDLAVQELERRSWLGNVRELKHTIEKAAIRASGGIIQIEDLPVESALEWDSNLSTVSQSQLDAAVHQWTLEKLSETQKDAQASSSRKDSEEYQGTLHDEFLSAVEPSFLQAVLEHCQGNRAATASLLGLHRSTLRQKMRRYHLELDK